MENFGKKTGLATAVLLLLASSVDAANVTLTFDGPFGPVDSYTEAGMTITRVAGLQIEGNGNWDLPINPLIEPNVYDLTTGGIFNLISIDILHSDNGDSITFSGYSGAALVAEIEIDADDFGFLAFSGFLGLDRVRIEVENFVFADPTFDNLTYAPVPLPSGLPLMAAGVGALGLAARRRARRS